MTRSLILLSALVALSLASACGGGDSGGNPDGGGPTGPGPCDVPNPPSTCGATCTFDTDCDVGLHCTSGSCTAECTIGGTQCGAGQECDRNGRCQTPSTNDPDANCPDVTVNTTPQVPAVELVIDRSGSMVTNRFGVRPPRGQPDNRPTRWDALIAALVAEPTGLVTALEDRVIFGASLYPRSGTCPAVSNVDRALNNRDAIARALVSPGGETPTGESLGVVIDDFLATPPPANSPPVIILATDGEPDTCSDGADETTGRSLSVAAAQRAFTEGIPLYILSVGADVATAHLQQVANAGVGFPPTGGQNAPFFVANDPAELASQLQQIIRNVRSCDLALDAELDQVSAEQGEILLGTQRLTFGTDWELLPDNKTIRLKGTACQTLLTTDAEVSATFPCGSIIDVD
jgi:hypothetical protein